MIALKHWIAYMREPKLFASILILLVIGLHALPVFQKLQGDRQTFWPFLAWGMYRNSRPAGPIQTEVRRVIGVTSKGERTIITIGLLGLSGYTFERLYIKPMSMDDYSAARQLAARLNHTRQDPFVELHLERDTYRLTDAGVVKQDNPIILYRVVD
jgi:hypothetical protein